MKTLFATLRFVIMSLLVLFIGCASSETGSVADVDTYYESLEVGMPIRKVIDEIGEPFSVLEVGNGYIQYSFLLSDISTASSETVGFVALVKDEAIVLLSKSKVM